MKSFLILILLSVVSYAFADGVTVLKDGDQRLSQADAKIIEVREICPINPGGIRCQAIGSIVTVKVTMNGCLDRFGGYVSKFEVIKNKGYLSFSAINIHNEASLATRCVQAPTKIVETHVPFNGEVTLMDMEYTGELVP